MSQIFKAKHSKKTQYPECLTLKKVRLENNLTQTELAIALQETNYTKINSNHICKFERGKQKPWGGAIALLCSYFDMVKEDLFPEIFG